MTGKKYPFFAFNGIRLTFYVKYSTMHACKLSITAFLFILYFL